MKLLHGDCLELMKAIPDKSIDMILCDPPYGTTANKWDLVIDPIEMWEQYERVIKDNGAIVLFASGSFTHKLILSNEELYRYKWIWYKNTRCNFVNAKNRPMTAYEEILVFSKGVTANGTKNKMKYFPQGIVPIKKQQKGRRDRGSIIGTRPSHKEWYTQEYTNYPCDVLCFDSSVDKVHPTQKPVELLQYLIKTYTNEGDIVLDNCMGSGSTGVACVSTNRDFIGMELDKKYFDIAKARIEEAKNYFSTGILSYLE